jgi:hypothetical protein
MNDSNRQLRRGVGLLCLLLFCGANYATAGVPPVVSNVRAAQRSGTGYVDITYDLADPDSSSLTVTVAVSTDAGTTWSYPGASLTGQVGSGIAPGAGKRVVWNAGSDLPAKLFANVRVQVTADDAVAPSGMALIPAGSFTMGNCMSSSEGYSDELPLHTVYVSAFYMDKYLVAKSLWDTVYQWAIAHGYTFDNVGSGKASTHPVQTIDWYDCVKWCNARSEKEGRAGVLHGCGIECAVSDRAGGAVCEVEYRLPFADGGGVGEGGAGRVEWAAVSVGQHDFVESGQLLCLPSVGWRLRLRCQPDGRLASDICHWGLSLHESGGVFCGERVWVV